MPKNEPCVEEVAAAASDEMDWPAWAVAGAVIAAAADPGVTEEVNGDGDDDVVGAVDNISLLVMSSLRTNMFFG